MTNYRVAPMHEPRGEGNGWEYCSKEVATAFYLEQQFDENDEDDWHAIDAFDFYESAEKARQDHYPECREDVCRVVASLIGDFGPGFQLKVRAFAHDEGWIRLLVGEAKTFTIRIEENA